jgi:predicted nuclease of predicted toxin-antitoxin system
VKFLVDAQLPQRFCDWLEQAGHDARHTLHLPNGNRTTDRALVDIPDRVGRVVITKDSHFVQSLLIL